jgi:PAS domain S-box-containing protein
MTGLNLADLVGFFDLMHDAVILVDRNHHIALYNRGAEELFGHAAKDVLGQDMAMLLPPSARKAHPSYVKKFAAAPIDRRMMGERSEIHGLRKDGSIFPAEASLSKVSLGDETWFLAVVRDMSLQQEINRQALESAREKARFFTMLNAAIGALPASITILSPTGDIVFACENWDHVAVEYSGGRITSAVGANMLEFCDRMAAQGHKDAGVLVAGIRKVLDGSEKAFELESSFMVQKKRRQFHTTVTPLPIVDGGAVVMSLDITKRVEIDNEMRIRGASLEGTLTPISIRSIDGKLTFANRAFLDLWRLMDSKEAIGRPMPEFYEGGQDLKDAKKTLMETGSWSGHRVTKSFDGSPGRYVFASSSLIRDKDGNPLCYVASFLDLTDRLKAEAAVRRRTDQMTLVTDTLPFMVAYVDDNLRLTFINREFERAFNILREDVLGEKISAVMPDYMCNHCSLRIVESLKGKKSEFEESMAFGSENVRIIRSIFLPHLENGRAVGVFVILEDITSQRRADEELRQSQKLQSIGTLAGGIAHDINNLLVPIMVLTELVRDDLTDAENVRSLDDVLSASERARQLVGQILAFSRKDAPNRVRIPLAPIVEEATDLLQATASRTVKISRDIQAAPPVDADETQIHQIVMNLCSNAIQAMGIKGGGLDVSLSSLVPDAAFFEKHKGLTPGEYVRLAVRDTGSGMNEHVLSRIFEPFFTTKEVGEGTGMGLSVVHGIVAVHQGVIEVQSELGTGTLFEIYLPAARSLETI